MDKPQPAPQEKLITDEGNKEFGFELAMRLKEATIL
jgi:hypothetical protein